jgi:hypothetical protein
MGTLRFTHPARYRVAGWVKEQGDVPIRPETKNVNIISWIDCNDESGYDDLNGLGK